MEKWSEFFVVVCFFLLYVFLFVCLFVPRISYVQDFLESYMFSDLLINVK